ncbi:Outer membrane protein beta-barrel domain-containing protein [Chitinophaga costaii]|uniref:Outer membrane protein beta-barrel domain-containing protein n=1 Tax=Chitinophaga costaii TaxID=1335309 RepID=A0A1C4ASH1_9BACT|nr:porin family protein [Chitinophaga costaii]PUZ26727.1 PorT family protein [Chitinophaga costaii]SCB97507.1 Outer membrane protein beta-barrel domain-containing protein [Chitinophaga costaii]
MRRIVFTLALIGCFFSAMAQDGVGATVAKKALTHSHDFLLLQLSYDGWSGLPAGVKTGFNRGFNAYFMYDVPLQHHLSVAPGIGFGTSGIYLKDYRLDNSTSNVNTVPSFSSSDNNGRFKIATTYLDIPVELRYRQNEENANKGFKAAIGIKAGYLLNAHTKEQLSVNNSRVIEKESSRRYFNNFRFAATARISLGNIGLFGTYNLNPIFKNTSQIDISAYSIGICLSGL